MVLDMRRTRPGSWVAWVLAPLGSLAGAAQPASPGGGHSVAALAGWVVAGLIGLVLLVFAVGRMVSGGRRDSARRSGHAKRAQRDSTASPSRSHSSKPSHKHSPKPSPSRAEPSWAGEGDDRQGDGPASPALRRNASIPRITDEVVAQQAARLEPPAPPPPPARPPHKPPASARALAVPPTAVHRDRVWNMLDEIRHVPLATRLAPIAGVPPQRRPAAAGVAPAAFPPAPAAAPPPAPPVVVAPVVPMPPSGPISAPMPAPMPTASAPPEPRPAALPAAQQSTPASEPGSSARWSDEKRAELRRAVDRLRASRDPEPRRRDGDAAPTVAPAGAGRAPPASERATRTPLPVAAAERLVARDTTVTQPHEFQPSSPGPAARARWVGPDEVVVVFGHAIPGMVFVGTSNRYSRVESDPALIDDELDVDTPGGTLAGGLDAANSSYASLEPAHRGAYLKWLAGGRPANAPASFALIFFMGLERRVIESLGRASALPELNRLAAEMRRLVETHGMDSFSLHHHATRLAALVEMQAMGERMYKRPVPPLHRTYDLPVELRLALGQVAHDQVPLPVAWAMAWLLTDQTFHLRSPMTRCPDEFRRLFEARYGERFGAGLQLPFDGRKLLLTYMPVSRSLASADGFHFPVDSALDVDAHCAAAGELRTLCSLCAEDLYEYCRYVGRHPSALASPDAELRLPAAIRSATLKACIAELRLACQAGRPPANLHEAALTLWGVGLADKDSAGLLQALLVAEGISVTPRAPRSAPA